VKAFLTSWREVAKARPYGNNGLIGIQRGQGIQDFSTSVRDEASLASAVETG